MRLRVGVLSIWALLDWNHDSQPGAFCGRVFAFAVFDLLGGASSGYGDDS